MLPQSAPDGNYCPQTIVTGDINGDFTINIQDVILSINIIIEELEYNPNADMNSDEVINVLDIVQIVNIILYPQQG